MKHPMTTDLAMEFELRLYSEGDDHDTWIKECNTENDDLAIPEA
jgi:hypothetical protein